MRRGGTLVTVRAEDSQVDAVRALLEGRRGVDVDARGAEYRQAGWQRFDEQAAPYTSDEVEAERSRRIGTS